MMMASVSGRRNLLRPRSVASSLNGSNNKTIRMFMSLVQNKGEIADEWVPFRLSKERRNLKSMFCRYNSSRSSDPIIQQHGADRGESTYPVRSEIKGNINLGNSREASIPLSLLIQKLKNASRESQNENTWSGLSGISTDGNDKDEGNDSDMGKGENAMPWRNKQKNVNQNRFPPSFQNNNTLLYRHLSTSSKPDPPTSPPPSSPPPTSPPPTSPPPEQPETEWNKIYRLHQSFTPTPLEETYRHIKVRQQLTEKLAREKTSNNIRRALTGNVVISIAKLGAWFSSGSSAMLSEFVHSLVDCGNQLLLLMGLRDASAVADPAHPYGYGKSVYFWALVSALGTFWLGAGVSMRHSIEELMNPSLGEIAPEVWAVLGFSLAVDGYVLTKTVMDIKETKPDGRKFWEHVWKLRDPATIAILLEDGAACAGIIMASCGIALSYVYVNPIFDGLAGVGISVLLAGMGIVLVRLNQRFLLGQGVDPDIVAGIEKILLSQNAIDNVHSVQSQWTGPDTFSYKAEVDFDGTYLAAKLMPRYQKEFMEAKDTLDDNLRVLLAWYAEDVMRTVEREVRHIEAEIRQVYPGATYIELEPDSKDAERFAIEDGMEGQLKRIENEAVNRYMKSLIGELSNNMKNKNMSTSKDVLKGTADADISDSTKSKSLNTGGGDAAGEDDGTIITFGTESESKKRP